jgi:hypothetical protein
MAEVKALRSASEADALEIIRRAGSVESVTALVAMLGWERTKTQRWLARRRRYGDIVLKPSGPGGKTVIEAARTPAQPPTEPDAQQAAQLAQVTAHPNISPDAPPARVDAHQDAHPLAFDPVAIRVDRQLAQPNAQVVSPTLVVERPARHLTAAAWVFGALSVTLSFGLFFLSTILNMSFWAALSPDMTIKEILAVGGLCIEFANLVIPSAISFAPRSYLGLRLIVCCVLCGTMVATAVASAGVVKASLGASQVQREQTNRDRARLLGIVNSVMAPVPDGVVDAQRRVATATALRKMTCAPTRNLDLDECAKAKAEERKAADALASENTKHETDLKAAELRHRQDVADAKAELDRLPVISLDQNVVAAGVNAIMPVTDAWVDRGVVVLWVLLFCVAPCAFLRLGLAILAPARWGRA